MYFRKLCKSAFLNHDLFKVKLSVMIYKITVPLIKFQIG